MSFDPVHEAHSEEDALVLAAKHRPDLIVLDLAMPGRGGLNLIEPLLRRASGVRILIFSMNEQPAFASKALSAGAVGYLSKNCGPEDFVTAVRSIEAGKIYLAHDMALAVATSQIGGPCRSSVIADPARAPGLALTWSG